MWDGLVWNNIYPVSLLYGHVALNVRWYIPLLSELVVTNSKKKHFQGTLCQIVSWFILMLSLMRIQEPTKFECETLSLSGIRVGHSGTLPTNFQICFWICTICYFSLLLDISTRFWIFRKIADILTRIL